MTPLIRRIQPDDWQRMRARRLHALADSPMAFGSTLAHERTFTDDAWRERAARASTGDIAAVFVAEREGQWVGTVTGYVRPDDPDNADPLIVAMFVDRSARGAGVGAALIEAVCGWARAWGASRITLWVPAGNQPAERLYGRCGFRPTGNDRPHTHTPTLDEREMVRELGGFA